MELSPSSPIPAEEKAHLRELAHRYADYSMLPVMREREKLWYTHNSLAGACPPVVMEIDSFLDDLLPPSRCRHPIAAEMENGLQKWITNHELVDDDKVIPITYDIPMSISTDTFGVDIAIAYSPDNQGRKIGFAYEHPVTDLAGGFSELRPSRFTRERETTDLRVRVAEDILGDILPIRQVNRSLEWYVSPSMQMDDRDEGSSGPDPRARQLPDSRYKVLPEMAGRGRAPSAEQRE